MDAPDDAVDSAPLKSTAKGAAPAAVEEEITAVGGGVTTTGGATGAVVAVTVVEAVLVKPVASETESLAVYEPAVV